MVGDLPPSSRETGISLSAASRAIPRPTSVPPVNAIFLTSGWRTSASPTIDPLPGRTLSTPLGTPASSQMRASASEASGVTSAGFKMTALPAASAGASFCASEAMGEFHGVIAATTPSGSCTLIVMKSPREGVSDSSSVSTHAAK